MMQSTTNIRRQCSPQARQIGQHEVAVGEDADDLIDHEEVFDDESRRAVDTTA